jgi:hypothetical protein
LVKDADNLMRKSFLAEDTGGCTIDDRFVVVGRGLPTTTTGQK